MQTITYDGMLDIAVGKSRNETRWKNKEVMWSELVRKFSETHRTHETYKEYLGFSKDRQAEIKDVGGFVGGSISGGSRKLANVLHKSMITLDADTGTPELWDSFKFLFTCAAAIYTTHKHSPEQPRYRLVIPLDRPVYADEYVAIARKVAESLGIDAFDPTAFNPHQLMYWPSTSKDGEYYADFQDGPWLSADRVLSQYKDWRDASQWAYAASEDKQVRINIKKQENPLEKTNLVGKFCRTYTIHEAIEAFLDDVYAPTDREDRYTYKEGSTGGGLVTYEDTFAHSYHGTDPASGKTCNAYDLVRIHKFGMRDKKGGQEVSNAAMDDFVGRDPKVLLLISKENQQGAINDFAEALPEDPDWETKLKADRKGNYISSIDNIYQVLKNDGKLKDSLYFDEFEGRLVVKRNLPWRLVTKQTRDFTDDDASCLSHYLESIKMPFTYIDKALAKIRTDHRVHPIKEYLKPLVWDGAARLDTLFIDYLGAADNPYTRSATRKMFVAAVARVHEPGIKFDTMLTLAGPEGIGKSTILSKMGKNWFSDCLGDIHAKEGMESLRGIWIMEIAELSAFRKAEQIAIKRFISSLEDTYRPAYGRQQVRYPRQCVFFASTNKNDFLMGSHGNRRDLPVATMVQTPTKNVFKDLTAEVDQLWAEAVHYYKAGESLDLSAEIKLLAETAREDHREIDDRSGAIEEYLNTLLPANWDELGIHDRRSYLSGDTLSGEDTQVREYVCVAEIWCEVLGGMQRDLTSNNTKYIHDIMRKMKGWTTEKSPRRFKIYGPQRAYKRVNAVKSSAFTPVNTKNAIVNAN